MNLKIASSNLNQTPLAWEKNFSNIRNSINDARKKISFFIVGLLKNRKNI